VLGDIFSVVRKCLIRTLRVRICFISQSRPSAKGAPQGCRVGTTESAAFKLSARQPGDDKRRGRSKQRLILRGEGKLRLRARPRHSAAVAARGGGSEGFLSLRDDSPLLGGVGEMQRLVLVLTVPEESWVTRRVSPGQPEFVLQWPSPHSSNRVVGFGERFM